MEKAFYFIFYDELIIIAGKLVIYEEPIFISSFKVLFSSLQSAGLVLVDTLLMSDFVKFENFLNAILNFVYCSLRSFLIKLFVLKVGKYL